MADETQAMVQMISLSINGAEKAIRGSAALVKVMTKVLLVVFMKVKQRTDLLPGERMLMHFALQGKPLQCLTMNAEQFELFRQNAKNYDIQYHHINDKKGKTTDTVTVFIPESDAHKFNELVRKFNLNSVENHGVVKAEDVNPAKALDKNTMIAEALDAEGVISISKMHDNLLKNGIDQDRIEAIIMEFLDSSELEAFVLNKKVVGFDYGNMDFSYSPELMEAIGKAENKASYINISSDQVPFGESGVSTRNWKADEPLILAAQQNCADAIRSMSGKAESEIFQERQNKIERILELGSNGDLAAIESDKDLAQIYEDIVSKPVTTEKSGEVIQAIEGSASVVSEVEKTVDNPEISVSGPPVIESGMEGGMEGGHGTNDYNKILDDLMSEAKEQATEIAHEITKDTGIDKG